jgi:hypothetical protein
MYRSVIDNEKVSLIFFLRVKNKTKIQSITRELTIRIKKLMNSPVKVYGMEEMSKTDNKLILSKNGIKHYNPIFKRRKNYNETDK